MCIRDSIQRLLSIANLGNLPSSSLLTGGGNLKTGPERVDSVKRWVNGFLTVPDHRLQTSFSELAESFVHVLRAVSAAGMYDQIVAMLVETLSNRALNSRRSPANQSDSGDE